MGLAHCDPKGTGGGDGVHPAAVRDVCSEDDNRLAATNFGSQSSIKTIEDMELATQRRCNSPVVMAEPVDSSYESNAHGSILIPQSPSS
jgi:hypothetical protein